MEKIAESKIKTPMGQDITHEVFSACGGEFILIKRRIHFRGDIKEDESIYELKSKKEV